MPAARRSTLVAALACAALACDAAAQGGGTNQMTTQDTPGGAKMNKIDAITIKQGAAAHKDAGAIKSESGLGHKDGAAHKDAIKGESKDGTTGILIGLTPKPEAGAAMSGDPRQSPAGVIAPIDHKAGVGVIAPIDHKAGVGVIAPIDHKAAITPSANFGGPAVQ